MNFTFGICTSGEDTDTLSYMISSILELYNNNSYEYEIILVGPKFDIDHPRIVSIDFNEKLRNYVWITKKKNIIIENAKYDNICFAHDYFYFDALWLSSWIKFNSLINYQVAMNKVYTYEGERHSDWCVNPLDYHKVFPELHASWDVKLPYDEGGTTPLMYIAANYWVAKTEFMTKNLMDETLTWKDAEDVEWSVRIRDNTTFKMNTESTVKILKKNKWAPKYIKPEYLEAIWAAKRANII